MKKLTLSMLAVAVMAVAAHNVGSPAAEQSGKRIVTQTLQAGGIAICSQTTFSENGKMLRRRFRSSRRLARLNCSPLAVSYYRSTCSIAAFATGTIRA